MKYDELLKSGRIRKEEISPEEINQALERAERDLKSARRFVGDDWDWSFAIAYNAVLQASRAYMFAQGFRPASSESHKNTFAFMHLALGREYATLMTYFDRMRAKRNRAIYDLAGTITETEARNMLKKADEFVRMIRDKLGKER
jgi:uncharacterized protein (UPF0332 family)